MYKLKYYSLSKEEKKELKDKFYETNMGKDVKFHLNRLFLTGIFGLIFGIILIIISKSIWETTLAISLIVICLFFIISSFWVRISKINDYLVKIKKKK